MKIYFDFYPEKKLMLQKYTGRIDKPFFIAYLKYLSENFDLSTIEKNFVDFRHCEPVYSPEEVIDVTQFRLANLKIGLQCTTVMLNNSPSTTVASTMYKKQVEQNDQTYEICSTLSKGINILNLPVSETQLEDLFQSLKFTFPH